MRNIICSTFLFVFSSIAIAAPAQKVQFGEITLKHAWDNNGSVITNEYIPEDQSLDNWQRMLTHRKYPGNKIPADVVRQYLTKIKPTQKPAVYEKGEHNIILVFLIEPSDKSYVEFNIHRFVKENNIVQSYQFATRSRGKDLGSFTDMVIANKSAWIRLVGSLKATDFSE